MSKALKNNFIYILSFIILFGIFIYNTNKYIIYENKNKESLTQAVEFCHQTNIKKQKKYSEYCELVNQNKNLKLDFFTMFTNTIAAEYNGVSFILFLFISIPTMIYICKYLKNNIIKNELTRKSYKEITSTLFKKAYKAVFILPLLVIIGMLVCALYTKNFNYEYAVAYSSSIWKESTMSQPLCFMIFYVLNTFFISVVYINICLCVARKKHNYIIAIILSFLVLLGIQAFCEIIINLLLFNLILKSELGYLFNIMNVFAFQDAYGIIYPTIITFIFACISLIVVISMYKNKEKLIIDCEANV